jgi:hypothetical protein
MRPSSRIASLFLFAFGVALLAWVAYDATSVQQALGLSAVLDEATVAVGGLVLGLGSLGAGYGFWRTAGRQASLQGQ